MVGGAGNSGRAAGGPSCAAAAKGVGPAFPEQLIGRPPKAAVAAPGTVTSAW